MNFADEEYVRLYITDTVTWDMLPWQAHCVLALGLRKFDRSGVFDFGKHGAERALVSKTKLPADVVSVGLQALLDEEVWVLDQARIFWPKYIEAQTCKRADRIRQREARARRTSEPEQQVEPPALSSRDKCHVSTSDCDKCHVSTSDCDKCHVSSQLSQNVTLGEAREGEGGRGILVSEASDARAHDVNPVESESRGSDPKPPPAPPQRAPEPASGTHPAASGAPDPIPPSERQPEALATKRRDPMRRSMETRPKLADELFSAYRNESGLVGAEFDGARAQLFLRLASEGVTVEQVRLAVRGAKLDPWARDTAKLAAAPVLSSADQREKFIAIARDPPRPKGVKAPPQLNDESNRYDPRKAGITVI